MPSPSRLAYKRKSGWRASVCTGVSVSHILQFGMHASSAPQLSSCTASLPTSAYIHAWWHCPCLRPLLGVVSLTVTAMDYMQKCGQTCCEVVVRIPVLPLQLTTGLLTTPFLLSLATWKPITPYNTIYNFLSRQIKQQQIALSCPG